MKKTLALAVVLAGSMFVAVPTPAAYADVQVSFSFFHDNLAPYGRWVTAGSYGRCWYPVGVPAGWQPYTVGHWGYGDYGWTWASYDPWGDLTYRYGTWTYYPPYGWVWVPGYVWGPAWVTWSYTNDYIGWAPIPPSFSFSVGGYFGGPVVVSRSWYCFVPTRSFATTNVAYARVPVRQNSVILARSQNVTRFPVSGGIVRNTGLDIRTVERRAETRVQRVRSRELRVAPARIETARTGGGRRISVAAPASSKPAQSPARVENRRSSRPPSVRERSAPARDTQKDAPRRDVRTAPEPRKPKARESEVSQPSQRSVSAPRASKPSKPRTDSRVSATSGSREKSRAVRASAPRPPASSQARPAAKSSGAKAGKPADRPNASSKKKPAPRERDRGRP